MNFPKTELFGNRDQLLVWKASTRELTLVLYFKSSTSKLESFANVSTWLSRLDCSCKGKQRSLWTFCIEMWHAVWISRSPDLSLSNGCGPIWFEHIKARKLALLIQTWNSSCQVAFRHQHVQLVAVPVKCPVLLVASRAEHLAFSRCRPGPPAAAAPVCRWRTVCSGLGRRRGAAGSVAGTTPPRTSICNLEKPATHGGGTCVGKRRTRQQVSTKPWTDLCHNAWRIAIVDNL